MSLRVLRRGTVAIVLNQPRPFTSSAGGTGLYSFPFFFSETWVRVIRTLALRRERGELDHGGSERRGALFGGP